MNKKRLVIILVVCCAVILGSGAVQAGPIPFGQPTVTLLATGLGGGTFGSTIGPDGALYVTEGAEGRISRVDLQTGMVTPFVSGLPPAIIPLGGVADVAFLGNTAYALVTLVGPDLGGSDVVGIYRIDGPDSYTVIADIGAYNLANPPTIPFEYVVPTGLQYAMEVFRGGFLVTDGHLNRVLWVSRDGEIIEVIAFGDTVPTGLAVHGNLVYLAEAGPTPHLPADGKVVAFRFLTSDVDLIASGAPLLVDVEYGRGNTLYALSQGDFPPDGVPADPAYPNTGALLEVNADGTFSTVVDELDRPTSLEVVKNTAYVVTLGGEAWKVDRASTPPFGVTR